MEKWQLSNINPQCLWNERFKTIFFFPGTESSFAWIRIRNVWPGSGSESFCLDPDPYQILVWIRNCNEFFQILDTCKNYTNPQHWPLHVRYRQLFYLQILCLLKIRGAGTQADQPPRQDGLQEEGQLTTNRVFFLLHIKFYSLQIIFSG